MEKFCIFCGKKPESKNREHVIPQWLIKMTGPPNREVFLGLKWSSPELERRRFSFKSFTLPACEKCNSECSDLEAKAKCIVECILRHQAIEASSWDVFLDWLDKVRTGLWLGMIYLNDNHRCLRPHFYINRRIGSKDRFLIVYEIRDDGEQGVGWGGTESPLFQCAPSCFSLTINNFLFFNASYDCLFSQRFGFPFACVRKLRPEGGEWIEMQGGTEKRLFPLIEKRFKTGGTQMFQPMIPYDHFRKEDGSTADFSELYNTEYVRANCMDHTKGRGLIFRRQRNELILYPNTPSKGWIPNEKFHRGEVHYQTGLMVGEFQEYLYKSLPSFEDLSDEQKQSREAEVAEALSLHKVIMDHFRKQKAMYY